MTKIPEHIEALEPMLTPEIVAEKLNVTPATVRNLCDRGEIEGAVKIGRQWRIPVAYLTSVAS